MNAKTIHQHKIGSKLTDNYTAVFIIAEAGVNHNGSIALAKQLIDVAAESGADAVKFQTFIAEEVVSTNAPKAEYQKQTTNTSESQLDMVKKLELSEADHTELMEYSKQKGIMFLSTPFDNRSVDLLVELGVPLIKISSGEITNHPFLKYIAAKGLPIILSTGMSTLEEVAEAVSVIKDAGCKELTLLHCTSNYPARVEDCNLLAMKTMADAFDVPVGYSDHTPGIYVSLAAAAMGACVIEKHFTLDTSLPGPDHRASLEPAELEEMVRGIRLVEKALGSFVKAPVESELEVRDVARRSIVAKFDIPARTVITEDMLAFKRPGTGILPKDSNMLIGKITTQVINKNEMLKFEKLE
ncbi:MAG: N-acetylneuraminate synthase [ANME-2 cluster archaeon]|nr:MAG: N-acetylneuraminate synthase [ANME-2 cluster archaeon]